MSQWEALPSCVCVRERKKLSELFNITHGPLHISERIQEHLCLRRVATRGPQQQAV